MKNVWDHLPNAKYITRMIESWRSDQQLWIAQWKNREMFDIVRTTYIELIHEYDVPLHIRNGIQDSLFHHSCSESVYSAILCLMAHEDCAYMLDSDPSELKLLAQLGVRKAILMYAACSILSEKSK